MAPRAHYVEGGFWVVDDKFQTSGLEKGEVVSREKADNLEDDIGGGVETGHFAVYPDERVGGWGQHGGGVGGVGISGVAFPGRCRTERR